MQTSRWSQPAGIAGKRKRTGHPRCSNYSARAQNLESTPTTALGRARRRTGSRSCADYTPRDMSGASIHPFSAPCAAGDSGSPVQACGGRRTADDGANGHELDRFIHQQVPVRAAVLVREVGGQPRDGVAVGGLQRDAERARLASEVEVDDQLDLLGLMAVRVEGIGCLLHERLEPLPDLGDARAL